VGFGQQLGGRGFFKPQHHVLGFGFDPLARVELDLRRGIGLGQDAAPQEFAGFFK
jgi:hypothetical protein